MYVGKYKPANTRARAHSSSNSTLNLYECMIFSYWVILKQKRQILPKLAQTIFKMIYSKLLTKIELWRKLQTSHCLDYIY